MSWQRKTLVLRADVIKLLETAAVEEGVDESRIVEVLIERRLSGYLVSVTGERIVIPKDRPKAAAEVNSAEASAA